MSITRSQLAPVHGFDNRIQWNDAISRTNDRLIRWVFGTGFLTVHLAVFGTSLLSALCWNLVSDPADLRVVEPFRYWGIVAIVHTVLAGGGVLAWKLFQMGKPDSPEFLVPVRARAISAPRTEPSTRTRPIQAIQSGSTVSPPHTEASPRKWSTSTLRKATPWAARDVKQGWPGQPAMIKSLTEAEAADAMFVDLGEATWPDSAPLSTALLANPESRSGSGTDHVVSVDHRSATTQAEASQTWIEGFIESRTRDKEQRWSWVKAAASSWLSRREAPAASEAPLESTPAQSEERAAPPPEPATDAENPGNSQT